MLDSISFFSCLWDTHKGLLFPPSLTFVQVPDNLHTLTCLWMVNFDWQQSCLACLQSTARSPLTQVSCDNEQTAQTLRFMCTLRQGPLSHFGTAERTCHLALPVLHGLCQCGHCESTACTCQNVLRFILKLTTNAKFVCLFQLCLLPV